MKFAAPALALLLSFAVCAESAAQPGAKPQAAAPAQTALTPQMLLGRWGDNGDCMRDIVFSADGSFRSYTGGGGRWTLAGDVMTMSGQGGTFQVRIAILDTNTLVIFNPDGTRGTSQRC